MSEGIAVYTEAGKAIVVPDGAGGIFLRSATMPAGSSGSISFPEAVGLTLRLYQVWSGTHTWTVDTDGSGYPRVNFATTTYGGIFAAPRTTLLLVFAA